MLSTHLLGSWRGLQSVAGVLENLGGASKLVFLPSQTAHKEELRGALGKRRFGLVGQDVTAPLLTLE